MDWDPLEILPPANTALDASMPAALASLARNWVQASNKAEPELAAPNEPPDPAVGGKSLSPMSMRTCVTGRPSISAAICVSTV